MFDPGGYVIASVVLPPFSAQLFSGDESMPRLSFAIIALVASALVLSACANTVTGVGRDVKATGRAVKNAVR